MAFFTTIAALGALAYGTYSQSRAAKKQAEAQQQIALQEQKAEQARQRAMELDARRRQREIIRNQQRARALSLATATAQGASGGSALPGAFGQISGDAGVNVLGVQQNLEIGRSIFGANQAISGFRSQIAGYQSDASFGAGIASLGGAVLGNIGTISALGQGFGTPRRQGRDLGLY